jgi:hypothetical protein
MTVLEAIEILNQLDPKGELCVYIQKDPALLPCSKIYLRINAEDKIIIVQ